MIVVSFRTSNQRKVITDTEFTQETFRQYNNTENENINVIDPDTGQLLPGAMMIKREMTLSEKCIYNFTTSNGRWDLLTRCLPYLFLLFLILYIGAIFIYYKFGNKKEYEFNFCFTMLIFVVLYCILLFVKISYINRIEGIVMKQLMNKIPLWVINALSVISGILTIITSFISIFTIYINWEKSNKMVFATLCCFIVLLSIRVRKYQKLAFDRQLTTSFVYHRLTHVSRDLFFEVMRLHKEKSENVRNLTSNYQNQLSILLTHLCDMMEKYCGQKTSSCIKLITRQESEIKNITLTTFCRSTNSETTRGIYESTNKEIRLDENTDFLYIVDPNRDSNLNYFYQGNLKEYAEELNKQGKQYKNSNSNWIKDYIGTIVVPIQIQHKRLYDSPLEDSLHIIGFLCIDSKSSSAFLKRQEKANVDMLKSFADIIYILLSQYQHYLRKMSATTSLPPNNG